MHGRKFLAHAPPARNQLAPPAGTPAVFAQQRNRRAMRPGHASAYWLPSFPSPPSCTSAARRSTPKAPTSLTNMATGLKLLAIASRHPTQLYPRGRCPCSRWALSRSRMRRWPCWSPAAAG